MTMTTLIEDGSNKCWASAPVGMSDGVIPSKKHQISDRKVSAVGSVHRQCVEMCEGHTNCQKERRDKFNAKFRKDSKAEADLEYIYSPEALHVGRESESHFSR